MTSRNAVCVLAGSGDRDPVAEFAGIATKVRRGGSAHLPCVRRSAARLSSTLTSVSSVEPRLRPEGISPKSGILATLCLLVMLGTSPLTSAQIAPVSARGSPSGLDLATMSQGQYAGAVSMAMEGMRLVYGEMTDEQEAKFEAKWQPLFNHPSAEVVNYLNKLNPLLLEFIAVRTALNDAAEAFDAAQLELAAAASLGDADTVQVAIESAKLYLGMMQSLSARMDELTKQILALGDPPNAEDLRRRARKVHEDAFKAFESPPSLLAIVPQQLTAAAARPYTFKALVNAPAKPSAWGSLTGEDLQLNWSFSDGKTEQTAIDKQVTHTFYLDLNPLGDPLRENSLNVQLIDVKSKKVLATATVPIEVVLPQGQWVLADRQVTSDPSTKGARFRGFRRNPETGQSEPIPNPPDAIFDGSVDISARGCLTAKDLTAQTGFFNLPNTYGGKFTHSWGRPPLRLKPTEKFTFEIETIGGDSNLAYSPPEAGTLAILDFFPWGPKQARNIGGFRADGKLSTSQERVEVSQKSQQKSEQFEAPRPYVKGAKGEPIEPTGQFLTLTISGSARFTQCSPSFRVIYRYNWDPTGKTPALGEQGEGPTGGEEESPEAHAERIKREQIEFHRENIKYFEQNIAALERGILTETNPDSRNSMIRDLLYQRDAMQREIDQINSIQTGQFVRTRTELDALNLKVMAEQSKQMADDWGDIRRAIDRVQRLIDQADPQDRDRLLKFFNRQVNSDVISRADADHVRRVTKVIGDQVMGSLERQAATTEEQAIAAAARLQAVQNIKAGADVSMMALSFVGGSSVYMTYQGATGYLEDGWSEAFRRTAGGYNTITTIAQAAIDGYQQGVLEHLEAYAQDPQKIRLDEQQAGFDGAMWSAGKAAAISAAMKLGGYVLSSGQCPPASKPTIDTLRQQARLRAFRARQTDGRIKVQLFQDRARALAGAGKTGAPKETIGKLRMEMEGAYRDIKTDYFAKLHLNAVGRAGDTKTLHYYNSCDRSHMRRVVTALDNRMTATGYSKQQYKLFSNSASKGKAGMDVDLGAVEPPRYVVRGGQKITNPAHVEWRKNITQRQPDESVVRRSPQEFQEAGQKNLEEAFKDVFGRPPGEAMTAFTTTYHPEAYRDIKWLGKKGMKTALVHETDPRWVQQAADVTGFKVNHLPKEHPQLGYYGQLQEQCRGVVKDINTKLEPMFPKSKNPEAVKHIKELREVMNQFVLNGIGPVEAEQRLRVLTGGEGIKGVQDRFSIMLKGLQSLTVSK